MKKALEQAFSGRRVGSVCRDPRKKEKGRNAGICRTDPHKEKRCDSLSRMQNLDRLQAANG